MCKFKSLGLLTSFQVGWFFLDYLWRCSEIWFKSTKHQKASLLKRSPWNVLTIWCGNVKEWNWKSTSNGVNILSCRHKYKEANEYGKRNKYSKMVQTISQGRKSRKMYRRKQFIFLVWTLFSPCINTFDKNEKFDRIWNLQGENFIFSSQGQKNRKKPTRSFFTHLRENAHRLYEERKLKTHIKYFIFEFYMHAFWYIYINHLFDFHNLVLTVWRIRGDRGGGDWAATGEHAGPEISRKLKKARRLLK